ncbi:MAG: hypothetical protein V1722_04710 [Candidatus Micrarchaeota archaeon]
MVERHPQVKRFYEEFFPGLFTNSFQGHEPFRRSPSLARKTALTWASLLKLDAVRETKNIPYYVFRRRLINGIKTLHTLSAREVRELNEVKVDGRSMQPELAVAVIYHGLPSATRSLSDKLEDTRLNFEHLTRWMKRPTRVTGRFVVRPQLFSHPEAPLYLVLEDSSTPSQEVLASFGFRLLRKGKRNAILSINNIQGGRGKKDELLLFSEQVGEPWYLHLGKEVFCYAKEHGFEVQGELPVSSTFMNQAQYARAAKHYEQTYHNLGMKKQNGVWKLS